MQSTRGDVPLQAVRNAVTLRSVFRYLTSIIDCGDRLMMRTRSSGRVAARLLPSLYPGDVAAGVPGLRVHEVTPRTLQLAHLPTGGRLDMVGSYTHSATAAGQREHLADELELAAHEGDVSLHSLEHVHPSEANHLHLAPAPTWARLLSAVLARAIALWWKYGIEPAWSPPSTLAWRPGPGRAGSVDEVGALLTSSVLGVPNAAYTRTGTSQGVLVLGAERMTVQTVDGCV